MTGVYFPLPDAARRLCEVSLGKPRLFNRLQEIKLLSTTSNLQVKTITMEVLEQGLKAAEQDFRQQAALNAQEERIRLLLQRKGDISDDSITIEELESLGFRAFE
jgi:hypothetical protein